jgi:Tol biopolymer transport system component
LCNKGGDILIKINRKKLWGLSLLAVLVIGSVLISGCSKPDAYSPDKVNTGNGPESYKKPVNQAVCGNNVCESGENENNCRDCGNFMVKKVETLTENAGRADWTEDGQWVVFDRKGSDGCYDVWIMKIDGTEEKCLTCNHPTLIKNNGDPVWHPSGEYIVFQGQDPNLEYPTIKLTILGNFLATPGGGLNNNLWVVDKKGEKFRQLTFIGDGMATLHPHFSDDGAELAWTEKTSLISKGGIKNQDYNGEWEIAIADFHITENDVKISDKKYSKPGDFQLYELGSFSPDGKELLFTFWKRDVDWWKMDIGRLDLITGRYEVLVNSVDWDEFPRYSPDGKHIVWLSSQGVEQPSGGRLDDGSIDPQNHYMDYWIMDSDGSNRHRLTYFNSRFAPEYMKGGINPADPAWRFDGRALLTKVRQPGPSVSQGEKLIVISF